MPTFKELTERFKSSGCELYTNEEEYNSMKRHMSSIFRYKATCGHENTVHDGS